MFRHLLLLCFLGCVYAFDKTYTIKGTATCYGEPVANAPVDLKYFDLVHKGEVLATVNTDEEGRFTVSSTKDTQDFASNDFKVYLEITSQCDKQKREGCDVLTAVNVPASREGQIYELKSLKLDRRSSVMNTCDEEDGY